MGSSWSAPKVKVQLRAAIERIKLISNKKALSVRSSQREVITLLSNADTKLAAAQITMERILYEQRLIDTLEYLSLQLQLMLTRLALLDQEKKVPLDMMEMMATMLYISKRMEEIPEMIQIANLMTNKYGSQWTESHINNTSGYVNPKVVENLSLTPPPVYILHQEMESLAQANGLDWKPPVISKKSSSSSSSSSSNNNSADSSSSSGGMFHDPALMFQKPAATSNKVLPSLFPLASIHETPASTTSSASSNAPIDYPHSMTPFNNTSYIPESATSPATTMTLTALPTSMAMPISAPPPAFDHINPLTAPSDSYPGQPYQPPPMYSSTMTSITDNDLPMPPQGYQGLLPTVPSQVPRAFSPPDKTNQAPQVDDAGQIVLLKPTAAIKKKRNSTSNTAPPSPSDLQVNSQPSHEDELLRQERENMEDPEVQALAARFARLKK